MSKEVNTESASSNHVTLFSNGMGHIQRVVTVPAEGEFRLSIPFNKEHIADALESLTVFGHVKFFVPPSYTPTNADDTTLSINPGNVTASLLTSLSGASFSYRLDDDSDSWHKAVLMGAETVNVSTDNVILMGKINPSNSSGAIPVVFVSIKKEGCQITRIPLDDIAEYRFDDPSVQSEIEKAIKANFQKIKPDSTFLDLTLASTSGKAERVVIAYKIPLAAWKLRYNIRQSEGFTLDGSALVDNCTDEDWTDTYISVVTGNPISFLSPDLAEINEPQRQIVRIVEPSALGHVYAEEGRGLDTVGAGRSRSLNKGVATRSLGSSSSAMMYTSNRADFDMGESNYESYSAPMAEAPGTDAKEVGDFAVFTSREPVSIKAKRSAVVPMFNLGLANAGVVLLYKESSHSRRPFRALKFKNEAGHDLGRGKVGIYKDGLFQGEAILETSKSGENRMLPFCLENGVRILKESKGSENTLTKLWITGGFGYEERRYITTTEYVINNKKDEPFKVLIEHTSLLSGAKDAPVVTGAKIMEKITGGYRLNLDLAPKEDVTVTVKETQIDQQKVAIIHDYNWIVQHVINPKLSLANNPEVQKGRSIQKEINDIDKENSKLLKAINSLDEDAKRLRENIKATKEDAGVTRISWIDDLDATTKEIKQIKSETLPELEAKRKNLEEKLSEILTSLEAEWAQS